MKKDIQTKIIPTIITLAVIALAFWFLQSKPWGNRTNQEVSVQESSFDLTAKGNTNDATKDSLNAQALIKDPSVYSHPSGFSFQYPKSFRASAFSEGEGEIVLVQSTDGTSGFQIYVTPFTQEDTHLTEKRLLEEIPDLVIEESQQINVAGGGEGLTFLSNNGSGKTREVWFIQKGYLFQVTAPLASQALLQEILKTWQF